MEEKKFFAINLFSSKKLNFLAAFTRTLLVMTMCGVLNAQEITVRGQIFDASSRESIELARITIDLRDAKNTIYSDKNGVFYIQIKKNTPVKFAIERYGYFHLHYHVQASSDTSLQIQLQPNPLLLNSVSITSSRKPRLQTMQQSTKPEYRFDLELLNELATSTAAGVLNFSPGIYIKNYGGFGGLKTISLRGMSANQSKILIDGIEYDNFQTGVTDLSILDLQSFHALDVYRGGDAALYGANALSGAINLITLPASPNRQFSYEAGLGAYDDYKQHLKFSGPVASLNSTAAVTWRSAQGDHQYKFNAFGEEKSLSRQNADFENLNLLIAAQKKRERMEAGFTTLFYRGERGVPGPVLQGAFVKSKARQKDYDTQITGRFTWQTSQDSFWRTALRWRNSELNYRDPLIKITPNGIDDSYNNQTFHAQSEYEIAGKKQRLSSKIELGHSELQGNNLAKPSESAY
ncbi:MAG: hypothetical protein DWQ10_17190 [Calditrichaeota bacterium]|nr:MAG: hypothetical protein DWQ10_17190 [Calditrichota bacterium]